MLVGAASARGLALTRSLVAEDHAVRAVTRTEAHRSVLEDAGAEVWIGTPDRIGSLRYGLENVTILAWCLGNAEGPREAVEPLHGSRLHMMLEKTIDTTVRGVLYERAGSVDPDMLQTGAGVVQLMHEQNEIPIAMLDADPGDAGAWAAAARAAIDDLLA
jgi:hypothetical protein